MWLEQGFSSWQTSSSEWEKKIGNINMRWYLTTCSQKPIRSIFIWKNHYTHFLMTYLVICRLLDQTRLQKTIFWTNIEKTLFSIKYLNALGFMSNFFFDNMCILSCEKSTNKSKIFFHDCKKKKKKIILVCLKLCVCVFLLAFWHRLKQPSYP